jgi:hypothetical protein
VNLKSILAILATILAIMMGNAAKASVIQWNLNSVASAGSVETVTGFFDYDTSLDQVTSLNVILSGPLATTYTDPGSTMIGGGTLILLNSGSSVPGTGPFSFVDVTLATSASSDAVFQTLTNVPLTGSSVTLGDPVSGPNETFDITGSIGPAVSQTPLPGTLSMFAGALAVFIGMTVPRRRKPLNSTC